MAEQPQSQLQVALARNDPAGSEDYAMSARAAPAGAALAFGAAALLFACAGALAARVATSCNAHSRERT